MNRAGDRASSARTDTANERAGREAAAAFREEFGLGVRPIGNIVRLIEQQMDVGVAVVPTGNPGHGMTMQVGHRRVIAVSCTPHAMRNRSTLAHEVGHLRLGSVSRSIDAPGWDKRTPEEIQADAFARHLLVPLESLSEAGKIESRTTALLSNIVQQYMASPNIVAIQLREAGIIAAETAQEWSSITTRRLASQFGWHAEYDALSVQTNSPRAPQALMARAVEAYRWGLIAPAAIARLSGNTDPRAIENQLAADGITPVTDTHEVTDRPAEAAVPMTPEELAQLLGDTD